MRRCIFPTILLFLSGCASNQRRDTSTGPASIERLDCGGRACTITTAGKTTPATVIFVQE